MLRACAAVSSRMLRSYQAVSVLNLCYSSYDTPESWRQSRFANKAIQLDLPLLTSCRGNKHLQEQIWLCFINSRCWFIWYLLSPIQEAISAGFRQQFGIPKHGSMELKLQTSLKWTKSFRTICQSVTPVPHWWICPHDHVYVIGGVRNCVSLKLLTYCRMVLVYM